MSATTADASRHQSQITTQRAQPISFRGGLTDPTQSQSAARTPDKRVKRQNQSAARIPDQGVKCQPYLQFQTQVKAILRFKFQLQIFK